jgi:alpha-D-ribose 1-methylphosphonate 5-phosphate C-P lyase
MARGHATCFLCGASARAVALRRVGQMHACSDEDACDERRRERVAVRGEAT